ncbi:hypothetical protein ACIBCO_24230 [Streptomyces violascens]|uniref:hypothetical protein n=1 Tax=Streptomyces violascens TaxID=67381 RepID=UPI0037A74F5D
MLGITAVGPARAATGTADTTSTTVVALTVTPDDPRHLDLTACGYNARFAAKPDSVRLVHSTGQAVQAVREAVSGGRGIAVRGGGHCLDELVDDPDVRIIADMSEIGAITYDSARRAFAVEAGTEGT